LIIAGTICDIFKNRGGYLILAQSTSTENAFNPIYKGIIVILYFFGQFCPSNKNN
jgi:hypothetical protein